MMGRSFAVYFGFFIAVAAGIAGAQSPSRPTGARDSLGPYGCVMHGVRRKETNAIPAHWRRGIRVASDTDPTAVVFRVFAVENNKPVSDAIISVGPASRPVLQLYTGDSGVAKARVPAGTYALTVVRILFKRYFDTVAVRPGFADTLLIALGNEGDCFY